MAKAVTAPTQETDALRDAYAARAARAPKDRRGPKALAERRDAALAAFCAHGFPTPALEAWKKTPLRALTTGRFSEPPTPGTPDDARIDALRLPDAAATIVVVDGRFDAGRSDLTGLPDGVNVTPLAAALSRGTKLPPGLGALAPVTDPAVAPTALNTALFEDGALIAVDAGVTVTAPIQIIITAATTAARTATFPRVYIAAGEQSQVHVLETHTGSGDTPRLVVPVTEIGAEAGAHVHLVRERREPGSTIHLGAVAADVGRDAEVRIFSFTEGGGLGRMDLRTALSGPGAMCRTDGVFLAQADQHIDHFTHIDHATPHTTSRETFKGVLAGAAHGVFTGQILVRAGAQGTDSEQENRNLLLSDTALVDTTPQLEIHADDVKCRHGSTIGRLPPDQIYYLRTRGLGAHEARRLLTLAFAADALDHIADDALRTRLHGRTAAWLDAVAASGARAEAPKKAEG